MAILEWYLGGAAITAAYVASRVPPTRGAHWLALASLLLFWPLLLAFAVLAIVSPSRVNRIAAGIEAWNAKARNGSTKGRE